MTETTKTPAPTIAVRFPDLPRRPAGFAPNPYLGPHWQDPEADAPASEAPDSEADAPAIPLEPPAEPDTARIAAELGHSLQLSRAGALALTRLQLAIKCGDRHAAMAAMDRLHAVDAEMERLVGRLPSPDAHDPHRSERDAIARHLTDQKLSLAFEKLAMLSEISGPDMVSPQRRPELSFANGTKAHTADAITVESPATDHPFTDPPIAEWPPIPEIEPAEWRTIPVWVVGLAALLAFAAVAATVWVLSGW